MQKLLLATNNRGKWIELQALLSDLPAVLVSPSDVGLDLEVVEDGITYAENAARKARSYAQASGLLTLADDSGLEVEALDGLPGLHSARFVPRPGATDADRRRRLLEQLQGKSAPWVARFRCVVAVAQPTGRMYVAEGVCPGEITPVPRGQKGFGYDPIFLLPGLKRTMAELDLVEKNRLSHRARATAAMLPILVELL